MKKEEKHSIKCPICGRPNHKKSEYCIFHASAEEKTEEEFKPALKEYIEQIGKENNDYNFESFVFVGSVIDFKKEFGVDIFLNANFKGAIFYGFINFEEIIFKGDAKFDNSKFNSASFKNTRFEGDLFLTKATFFGVVTFEKAMFFKYANFGETIFLEEANFNEMSVLAVNFFKTTFKKYALFMRTNFRREILCWYARFESLTYFNEAKFPSHVNFSDASFQTVTFEKAIFKKGAIFSNTIFNEVVNFENTNLTGNIFFNNATFKSITKFILIGEQNYLDFTFSKFSSGIPVIIEITKGEINFENAILENISLILKIKRSVSVNFERAVLKNTQLKREDIELNIMQEKKNKYPEAKEIYLMLKNNFHSTGRYDDESWAFKKEKDLERFSHSYPYHLVELKNKGKKENHPFLQWIQKGNFKNWIISAFWNMIYGYGEKPWNVIKTAAAIIIIFALSFSFIGLGNPEIIELKGTAIHQNTGNMVDLVSKGLLKNNVIRNFPDSLYFSTITFTTLGYGDFRPLEGWGRILAGSEAFIGAFMMALFVYTFARRTGGR